MSIATILLALALVCFVLAAFNRTIEKISLQPLGLALLTLAMLVESTRFRLG